MHVCVVDSYVYQADCFRFNENFGNFNRPPGQTQPVRSFVQPLFVRLLPNL